MKGVVLKGKPTFIRSLLCLLLFSFGAHNSSSRRVGQFTKQPKGAGILLDIGHVSADARHLRLDFATIYALVATHELRSTHLCVNVLVASMHFLYANRSVRINLIIIIDPGYKSL